MSQKKKISSYENKETRNTEIDDKKLKELKLAQLERDGDFEKEDTLNNESE